jgi:predicted small secreted protein
MMVNIFVCRQEILMTKKVTLLIGFCVMAMTLSGCSNTFEGAGRDIEGAGEWIQDTF